MSADLQTIEAGIRDPDRRDTDRRGRILEAAERAFATHGFRGGRMQDVAAEAGMSAGNLYRYFPSKNALVSGLVNRDQTMLSADFALLSASPDLVAGVEAMLRFHLVNAPRERLQMILEVSAEAARNPEVAALCARFDQAVCDAVAGLIAARPEYDVDGRYVARLMSVLCDGLFKARLTDPTFDPDREIGMALDVFRAALDGRIASNGEAAK